MNNAIIADEIFNYAKLIELHMNLSIKDPDINRINRITEITNNLKHIDKKNL